MVADFCGSPEASLMVLALLMFIVALCERAVRLQIGVIAAYPSVGGHKAWFKLTSPSGTIAGRNTFISDLNKAVFGGGEWYPTPNGNAVRPGDKMSAAEPLIFDYHLDTWMNPAYRGTDVEKLCHPDLKPNYKGLLRYEQDGGQ